MKFISIVLSAAVVLQCVTANGGSTRGVSLSERPSSHVVAATSTATKTTAKKAAASKAGESGGVLGLDGGVSCILGGALAHLIFGTLYAWGNFMSYAPNPSLRFFDGMDHPGAAPDAVYVIPLTLLAQATAMPFGPGLVAKYGPAKTQLLGSMLVAASVYAASFQTSLGLFMFFYSILFGVGTGLGYTAPMIAGWKWKPNAKGLVSGGILTGFGLGGFIFSLIGTKLVNPKGLNAIKGKFPQEVYDNFPKMLRTLSGFYAVTALLGSLLVKDPPVPTAAASKKSGAVAAPLPGVTVAEGIRTKQFWLMWCMIVSSASAGLNVASIYKSFASGAPALAGDGFQAGVGALGALFNGAGRLLWGLLADKIGFKKSFTLLTLMQATLMTTYSHSTFSRTSFTANTALLFLCLAGNLALMPSAAQRMFGPRAGATIYGVMFSAFGVASVFGSSLTKALAATYGWNGTFSVLAVLSAIATIIVSQLQPIASFKGSAV